MKTYIFDVESNGLAELKIEKSGSIIKECDTIHVLVLRSIGGEVTVYRHNDEEDTIAEGWRELCSADVVIGHNIIDFDLPILRRLYGGDVKGKVFDTLVAARLLWPDAKHHPFGGNSIEAFGKHLGMPKIGTDITDWSVWTQKMEDRCIQDTKVQHAVFDYIKPKLVRFKAALRLEHRVADIISRQKDSGVYLNVEQAEKFIDQLVLDQAECLDILNKIFPPRIEKMKSQWWVDEQDEIEPGVYRTYATKKNAPKEVQKRLVKGSHKTKEHPFNPDSSLQVAQRLKEKYGWDAPMTDAGRPSVTEETLQTLHFEEAQLLLRFQMASKRLQHLKDWVTRARNSRTPGCIHPSINTNGAATGRMTHQQPNQTAAPKVKSNADGPIMGFEGRYGWEMRSLWGPRPGWVQVGGDASGLELRMLGHALHPWDGGAYAKEVVSGDIHTLNQKAGGLHARDQSKTVIYARLYGAGNEHLGTVIANHASLPVERLSENQKAREAWVKKNKHRVNTRGKRAGQHYGEADWYERQGKNFTRMFEERLPAIKRLADWCQQAASEKGFLPLPDGRHVPIRSAHAALNTLLQGSGAIVMKLALVIHHDELLKHGYQWDVDFAYMLNAHDEFQLQCRPEIAEEVGQLIPWSIAEAGRRLKIKCELTGDYKIGPNWAHTH